MLAFQLDPATFTVTYDGAALPFEVFDVREVPAGSSAPVRHTFATTISGRLHVQVSWSTEGPTEPRDGQFVWSEASYDIGQTFFMDRAGAWAKHVRLGSTPGEYPVMYLPRLQPAEYVFESIVGCLVR